MLRFMKSPVFAFNEQLLEILEREAGRNEHPYKRVFVNLEREGMTFHTMARFREVTVTHIAQGLARVMFIDRTNESVNTDYTTEEYDRKELKVIAEAIIRFLEGPNNSSAEDTV